MDQINKSSLNKKQINKKVFVLDASAIYNGILTHNLQGDKYIPDCVISEIKDMLRGEAIIEEALLYDELKILSPQLNFLTTIQTSATKTGDIQELSECDMAVLALAIDLKSQGLLPTIISDDYDIQNLASYLHLSYRGIHWKGITKIHKYHWSCPGCGEVYLEKQDTCLECGTDLIKKVRKQKIH